MPTVTPTGQFVMGRGDTPGVIAPPPSNLNGGIASAAAATTQASQAQSAATFKAMGAGQKGAGKRRRRFTGGASQNVAPSIIPTAHSVPGANPTDVGQKLAEVAAQVKAGGVYDNLIGSTPYKVGGLRIYGAEDLYPGSGTHVDTKQKRKTKKKNGRRHKRTHRRKRSRSHNLRRRSSRRV